jgi:DNA-binding IclR family transcriptional regulator
MMSQKLIKPIANARDVIELLSNVGPLSLSDISERTGIPRSSVYRLVDSLNAMLLTEPLADGRIWLTSRWLHLSDSTRNAMGEWGKAKQALDELGRQTKQTVYLSVPADNAAVCIDWVPGRGLDILILRPGRTLPLHAGAAGRVVLAYGDDSEDYLRRAPLSSYTPYTMTTAEQLRQDILVTQGKGFALSDQDVTLGIGAIGVPVFDDNKAFVGCVSIGGLIEEIISRQDEFVTTLKAAARDLWRDEFTGKSASALSPPGSV